MTVLQTNRKRGHKFIMSGAMFGFCMARSLACILRIVWANRPHSVSIAIVASLFIAIGTVLGFVVNLNFVQRILRALHPKAGWHPALKIVFIIIYSLIAISMVLLIVFTVASSYTLDPAKLRTARDVQRYGATYFATVAFLPIPLVLGALGTARRIPMENFGSGSFWSKIMIVLVGATTLSLGAWFRAGTSYLRPRPISDPGPYQSKVCFYIFYFTLELLVIWTYLIARIDQRFHVPDGSRGPGDYSRSMGYEKEGVEAARAYIKRSKYIVWQTLPPVCESPVIT